jgi:hypothetical protein
MFVSRRETDREVRQVDHSMANAFCGNYRRWITYGCIVSAARHEAVATQPRPIRRFLGVRLAPIPLSNHAPAQKIDNYTLMYRSFSSPGVVDRCAHDGGFLPVLG